MVGFGHFRRCEEAVVLFEVRRQISVAVLVFDVPADFVDDLGILMGTDGQGRRKVIIAQFLHFFGRRFHALDEADAAAGAAFGFVFQALDSFEIRIRFIRSGQELDGVPRFFIIGRDELFLDEFPPPVFRFRMDIGVEIVDRHVGHAGQPVQDGRTARAAAGMEQDARLDAVLLPAPGHALENFIEVDPLVLIHAVQNIVKINHALYSLSIDSISYYIMEQRPPHFRTEASAFSIPPMGLYFLLFFSKIGIMVILLRKRGLLMHIPENYLSPSTCGVLGAVMVPIWLLSIRKVKETVPREKLPLLGIAAAFSFLAMMFNIPLPGGTTGHAVGGTLIAILFGPYAACLAVSVALLIQALFFGDGGILAFGANCFNMAFVLPFTGYFIYHGLKKVIPSETIAAGIGAYIGINAAAFCAAVEFGIQPLLFTDGAGQALYCPYPLWISIPAMMIGHLTLFGLAEVVFTTGILTYLRKTSPDLFHAVQAPSSSKSLFGLLAALIAATPLGLLAAGTAWGEWDAEELADTDFFGSALGYTPSGMEQGFSFDALMPDYAIAGLPDAAGYIISAIVGTALLIIIFKVIASFLPSRPTFDTPAQH